MRLIKGFENYSITFCGRVINNNTGKSKKSTDNHSGRGYLYVDLYQNGKRKRKYIHRLVAEAYIPNPKNLPLVNHIDGNSKNNIATNLEWCTARENVDHAAKTLKAMNQYQKANQKRHRPIFGIYLKTGEKTKTYTSIREAERDLKIPSSNIVANLKGRQSHTKGICWCYVEEAKDNG